jgi:hypothetical protein
MPPLLIHVPWEERSHYWEGSSNFSKDLVIPARRTARFYQDLDNEPNARTIKIISTSGRQTPTNHLHVLRNPGGNNSRLRNSGNYLSLGLHNTSETYIRFPRSTMCGIGLLRCLPSVNEHYIQLFKDMVQGQRTIWPSTFMRPIWGSISTEEYVAWEWFWTVRNSTLVQLERFADWEKEDNLRREADKKKFKTHVLKHPRPPKTFQARVSSLIDMKMAIPNLTSSPCRNRM